MYRVLGRNLLRNLVRYKNVHKPRLRKTQSPQKRFCSAQALYADEPKPKMMENMKKNPETPLGEIIKEDIKKNGPMTLMRYMEMCLQHPEHGYYTTNAEISEYGDFVTSPELYHGFGECCGVWIVFTWQQMAKPEKVHLIELGPGTGQLMKDVLKVATLPQVSALKRALEVHFIESSPRFRKMQAEKLGVMEIKSSKTIVYAPELKKSEEKEDPKVIADRKEVNRQYAEEINKKAEMDGTTKISPTGVDNPMGGVMKEAMQKMRQEAMDKATPEQRKQMETKIKEGDDLLNKEWEDLMDSMHMDTKEIEKEFEYGYSSVNGVKICWHDSLDTIPKGPTLAIAHEFFDALPIHRLTYNEEGWREILVDVCEDPSKSNHFEFITAKEATQRSQMFESHCKRKGVVPEIGQTVETCPAANLILADVAERVNLHGGAGFIIDYGGEGAPSDSLQAVRRHKYTDVFKAPGTADITAHVDFAALKATLKDYDKVNTYGLVTQSYFLQGCGIVQRAEQVAQQIKTPEEREQMLDAFGRVADIGQMGGFFKAMAFAHTTVGVPVGFLEQSKKDDLEVAFNVDTGQILSAKKLAKLRAKIAKENAERKDKSEAVAPFVERDLVRVHSVSSTHSNIDEWKDFLLTNDSNSWFSRKGEKEFIILDLGQLCAVEQIALTLSGASALHLPSHMFLNYAVQDNFEDVAWEVGTKMKIRDAQVDKWHDFKVGKNARWLKIILHQTHGKDSFGITQIKVE